LENDDAYLNRKVGDIRSIDETTGCYAVYFEDGSIAEECEASKLAHSV
jgi:hypothetical protein